MKIEINASKREAQGTGASRRLRRSGKVPGILYGAEKDVVAIELDHKDLFLSLRNEAFHASILTLVLDGKKESVLLRDVQMHPFKALVLHADFQRVSDKERVHMKVPLHFVNAELAPGVKLSGSTVTHIFNEVEVLCLPKDLPEFVEVDLAGLAAGHSIHLSELKLPKGVDLADLKHGDDKAVVSIPVPRGGATAAAAE